MTLEIVSQTLEIWGPRGALNMSCCPGTFYLDPQTRGDPQSRESLGDFCLGIRPWTGSP